MRSVAKKGDIHCRGTWHRNRAQYVVTENLKIPVPGPIRGNTTSAPSPYPSGSGALVNDPLHFSLFKGGDGKM